ncbi:MAG: DUF3108 domain-containing protein [Candidatus Omnitrophica bacterium]|nr:DUF3108 domain-containing protein [Candidatus Omnitrophota bacterium]MDD5652544.1 DUF3108 domain-containing protein [Candidatus Omnitrophota bacterium]
MQKKNILYLSLFIFCISLLAWAVKITRAYNAVPVAQQQNLSSEYIGEKIVYDVYAGWFHLGTSTYTRLPNAVLKNKEVAQATFETRIKGFYDLERIFSDRETALPIQVLREIDGWGLKEKITEDYDQKALTLKFTKFSGSKKEESSLQVKGPIHNAVLLPFYIRKVSSPQVGWSMLAYIPQQFEIKLVAEEEVKIPSGTFKAYLFKSVPANFEIWVSADECRIPLKIKSSGSTMVMKEYKL